MELQGISSYLRLLSSPNHKSPKQRFGLSLDKFYLKLWLERKEPLGLKSIELNNRRIPKDFSKCNAYCLIQIVMINPLNIEINLAINNLIVLHSNDYFVIWSYDAMTIFYSKRSGIIMPPPILISM